MIDKYINQLLHQQTSVSVPKLGTFSVIHEDAQTDTQKGVIQPPHKRMTFSTHVDEHDHSLKNAVIEGEQINDEDYELQINKFIENIDAQIITFGEYKLKNVGILTKDANDQYTFSHQNESSGKSYGLPPVNATPITRHESQKMKTESKPKPQKASSGNKSALWMIIIPLICLFAFLVFLSTHKGGMQGLKSLFGNSPDAENVTDISVDSLPVEEDLVVSMDSLTDQDVGLNGVIDNIADNVDETIGEVTEKFNQAPPTQKSENQNNTATSEEGVSTIVKGKFYVVAGSFSSTKAANAFIKKSNLTDLKIVPYRAKSMYRVVLGEFDSEASATNKMNELGASSAWVVKL